MKKRLSPKMLRFIHTIFAMERDLIVGGQAVMQGVMMRHAIGLCHRMSSCGRLDRYDRRKAAEMER